MATSVVLGMSTVLTAAALLLVALAFATDRWTEYTVNRAKLKQAIQSSQQFSEAEFNSRAYFYSRHRGLFRECFAVRDTYNETKWLDARKDVVDGKCLPVEYEIPQKEEHTEYGSDYDLMIQLRRCNFAFLICSMLLLLIGCFAGAVGCWFLSPGVLRSTGIIVFLGAFFAAASMAFFHSAEYLERDRVPILSLRTDQALLKDPISSHFRLVWKELFNREIESKSRYTYGWSYIVGWIGMGLGAVAAILFLCAAYSIQEAKNEQEPSKKKPVRDEAKRNRAYQYMEHPYPDDYKYGVPPGYSSGGVYPGGYNTATYPGYDYQYKY